MGKINAIILVGLPASGKTTLAKSICKKKQNYVRVNRDDIRAMLSSGFSLENEDMVKEIERSIIQKAVSCGHSVIIDDTNISQPTFDSIRFFLKSIGVLKIEITVLNTGVEECVKRDSEREKSVGPYVILKMNKLFDRNKNVYGVKL